VGERKTKEEHRTPRLEEKDVEEVENKSASHVQSCSFEEET